MTGSSVAADGTTTSPTVAGLDSVPPLKVWVMVIEWLPLSSSGPMMALKVRAFFTIAVALYSWPPGSRRT
jgi:hypothetical protein